MKIAFIVLAVIVVVGFFMGWFNFSAHNSDGSSTANMTMTVDKDKIAADKDKLVDQMHNLGNRNDPPTPDQDRK
ncbi:MAG: hypothetical protein WC058_04210 [Phycisphaeraceae bacterium]